MAVDNKTPDQAQVTLAPRLPEVEPFSTPFLKSSNPPPRAGSRWRWPHSKFQVTLSAITCPLGGWADTPEYKPIHLHCFEYAPFAVPRCYPLTSTTPTDISSSRVITLRISRLYPGCNYRSLDSNFVLLTRSLLTGLGILFQVQGRSAISTLHNAPYAAPCRNRDHSLWPDTPSID